MPASRDRCHPPPSNKKFTAPAMEASTEKSGLQTVPGILTAIAAVLTALTGFVAVLMRSDQPRITSVAVPAAPATNQQTPTAPLPPAQPDSVRQSTGPVNREPSPARLNLSGQWRDNWGTVYQFAQDGDAFRFEAEGASCSGGHFRSSGAGTVSGNSVQSTYQSNLPSRGSCSGTLSSDGVQINST